MNILADSVFYLGVGFTSLGITLTVIAAFLKAILL